jgi:hypothetical protein
MIKTAMPSDPPGEVSQGPTCGIIMPLSPIDGCTAEHWDDVQSIIKESVSSIQEPVFSSRIVSDADEVGVIQKRIVQNIYLSDVVVCKLGSGLTFGHSLSFAQVKARV